MKPQPDWGKLVYHPSIIIIIGSKREGKTGLACVLLDHFHNKGLDCYVIGNRKMLKAFPKWVKNIDPKFLRIPNDAVVLGDDLHLYASARKWYANPNEVLDKFGRESGHKDITFIYTTQQAFVIDKNIIGMVDALFIKKPSLLQTPFERAEVRKRLEFVEDEFKERVKKGLIIDTRKHVYSLTHSGENMIGPYDLPKWFNEDISKIYRETGFRMKHTKRFDEIVSM